MVEIIADKDRRIINGWGTVSVVDRQNDYIDVLKEFRDAGVMEKMMKRGAVVIDSHSNHVVGRIIKFEYKTAPSGNPGLYLTAEIFKDYPSDDEFWQAVLDKKYSGFSLGGKATTKTPVCNEMGCHNNLEGIESWEWSCVSTPANQEALFDNVNKLAKSSTFSKDDAKQIGDKLKIDWNKISLDEFTIGLNIELEHGKKNVETNITNDDEILTAKIALAHLNEFPDYYSKSQGLPKLENQLSKETEVDKGIRSFLTHVSRGVGTFLDTLGEYETDEWVETHWKPFSRINPTWNNRIKEVWRNKDKEYSSKYKIYKARVYIKNPSEAPQGVKIKEGKRGGHYYESTQTSQEVEHKPEEKPQHYEELKSGNYYKGFDGKYDVFHFENTVVKVNLSDLPSDVVNKVLQCSDSFKFSSLKKKPNIILLGKSEHHPFTWVDRNGQLHNSEYAGTAEYVENVIKIWDDFTIKNIVYHEVGHFVWKNLFKSEGIQIYSSIEGFESIKDINKYNKMIEILKNHNVPIDLEHITGILDNLEYARNFNILRDMHRNELQYYDEGYNTLFALEQRLRHDNPIELHLDEIKEWKKFRTDRKAEIKSNTLRSEWIEIYKNEGFFDNEYANRNYSECFAEFYQWIDNTLRENDLNIKQNRLKWAEHYHPKKLAFFKKYIVKKWLK